MDEQEGGVLLDADEVRAVRWLLHYWSGDLAPDQHSATPPTHGDLEALTGKLAVLGG